MKVTENKFDIKSLLSSLDDKIISDAMGRLFNFTEIDEDVLKRIHGEAKTALLITGNRASDRFTELYNSNKSKFFPTQLISEDINCSSSSADNMLIYVNSLVRMMCEYGKHDRDIGLAIIQCMITNGSKLKMEYALMHTMYEAKDDNITQVMTYSYGKKLDEINMTITEVMSPYENKFPITLPVITVNLVTSMLPLMVDYIRREISRQESKENNKFNIQADAISQIYRECRKFKSEFTLVKNGKFREDSSCAHADVIYNNHSRMCICCNTVVDLGSVYASTVHIKIDDAHMLKRICDNGELIKDKILIDSEKIGLKLIEGLFFDSNQDNPAEATISFETVPGEILSLQLSAYTVSEFIINFIMSIFASVL